MLSLMVRSAARERRGGLSISLLPCRRIVNYTLELAQHATPEHSCHFRAEHSTAFDGAFFAAGYRPRKPMPRCSTAMRKAKRSCYRRVGTLPVRMLRTGAGKNEKAQIKIGSWCSTIARLSLRMILASLAKKKREITLTVA